MSPPQRPPPCIPWGSVKFFAYGYEPSLVAGITFTIFFGLIASTQLQHAFRYRAIWMVLYVVGSGLECLGWIGRTIAHNCPYSRDILTMQAATLIMGKQAVFFNFLTSKITQMSTPITVDVFSSETRQTVNARKGPAWTQAGVYVALWVLITILGRHVSPLPPKTYLFICFWIDVVCLTLQATGGGLAGAANTKGESMQPGTTTMVVGIIAQLLSTFLFSIILAIMLQRGAPQIRKNRSMFYVSAAIVLSTVMMTLRGFYRSVELVQGWTGYLITHQGYMIGLDAVPMLIAMGALAIFNPGSLFQEEKTRIADEEKSREGMEQAG